MYEGPWTLNGVSSSTTHSTTSPGSTVTFLFNASGIVVFGTVPASNETVKPPTAVYILDEVPTPTTEPTADRAISNQPLFAASQLSSQQHKLVINSNITQDVVDPSPSLTTATPGLMSPQSTMAAGIRRKLSKHWQGFSALCLQSSYLRGFFSLFGGENVGNKINIHLHKTQGRGQCARNNIHFDGIYSKEQPKQHVVNIHSE
ncbi:hypothetical protein BD779DRAFT_1672210 [Infundibulicybe gibba]|nr:hypothetical protein BD779DRAFT_1672210 [Infundibulicybe gibba]